MSTCSSNETDSLLTHLVATSVTPARPRRQQNAVGRFVPFPVDALPAPFRDFTNAASAAIGCDPSYVALPLLVSAAAAIGNTRQIMLREGWKEPAIIWAALVGESGQLKTPALSAAMRRFEEYDAEAIRHYERELPRHETAVQGYEAQLSAWRRAVRSNPEAPTPAKPSPPPRRRHMCSDVTAEAIADRLKENPRGLLLVRDELSGWFKSFGQYKGGKGDVAPKWLSMHQGSALRVDRRTGNTTIYVPRAAVSICGGIQPEILRQALGHEHFENGLAARFLLTMPLKRTRRWTEAEIGDEQFRQLGDVFRRLWTLDPSVSSDREIWVPESVRLQPPAQQLFVEFVNRHGQEQAALTGDLCAAFSKLEGYAARLALVFEFVDWASRDRCRRLGPPFAVGERSVRAAIRLIDWFKHETERVYSALP